jgi:ubiquinone/menaquinone biosynthesis C-methylase UbiE
LVFGNALEDAIKLHLNSSSLSGHVLIVGGGNDNSLNEVLKHHEVTQVTYVDLSERLVYRAKQNWKDPKYLAKVHFEVNDFLDWHSSVSVQHICMPFFMDLFSDQQVTQLFQKTYELLSPKGQLHIIDFHVTPHSSVTMQRIIRVLYLIFGWFTGVKRQLPPRYMELNKSNLTFESSTQHKPFLIGQTFTKR